jgi:hypothetical protein
LTIPLHKGDHAPPPVKISPNNDPWIVATEGKPISLNGGYRATSFSETHRHPLLFDA